MSRHAPRPASAFVALATILLGSCAVLSPLDDSYSSGGTGGTSGAVGSSDGGPAARVRCPLERCGSEQPVCCTQQKAVSCRPEGACADGVIVRCRDGADCEASGKPGTVCCLLRNSSKIMIGVECLPAAECVTPQHILLCDRQAPACPSGKICSATEIYNALDGCVAP